mgnify:CR=1 FL=1
MGKLRASYTELKQAVSAKLQPLGITDIPDDGDSSLLESLKARLEAWQAQVKKKADIEKQMANIEIEMEKKLEATRIAQYLLSFPGIGVVTAAGILGEIGDPKRFESWEQVRKYAGFNLVEDSSGDRKGKTVVSKRGRAMLRNILYQAALVMVAKNKDRSAALSTVYLRITRYCKPKAPPATAAMRIMKNPNIIDCLPPTKKVNHLLRHV